MHSEIHDKLHGCKYGKSHNGLLGRTHCIARPVEDRLMDAGQRLHRALSDIVDALEPEVVTPSLLVDLLRPQAETHGLRRGGKSGERGDQREGGAGNI